LIFEYKKAEGRKKAKGVKDFSCNSGAWKKEENFLRENI